MDFKIKKITKIILGVLIIFLGFSLSALAQQEKLEQKEEALAVKYPEAQISPAKIQKPKCQIETSLMTIIGVDSNPYLDASKKADSFNQELLNFNLKKILPRDWVFNLEYQNNSVIYHHEKPLSFYENSLNFNFENKPVQWLLVRLGYEFDFLYYHKLKDARYFYHSPGLSVRTWFTKSLYQEFGIKVLFKHFTKRMSYDRLYFSTTEKRRDTRPVFDYEIGKYFKKSLLKFSTQHYENDSNDEYYDRYDYNSHRFNLSFVRSLNPKFYYLLDIGFERRNYSTRLSDLDISGSPIQEDSIYKINSGFFYDINKNLSLNLNWSWRQSDSNSASYEYAGYITSLGLEYRF